MSVRLSWKRIVRRAFGCAGLVVCAVRPAAAQQAAADTAQVTLLLQGVPAGQALDQLASVSGISLLYDSRTVTGARPVFCRADRVPAETVLRCIAKEAGLDFYRLSSGTYVVIASAAEAPQWASLAGEVLDAASGTPVPMADVALVEVARADDRSATQDVRPSILRSVTASDLGVASFARLAPGRYRLQVRAIGYRPGALEVELPPRGAVRRRLLLDRSPVALAPIVVNGVASPAADSAATGDGRFALDSLPLAVRGPDPWLRGASAQLGIAQRAALADLHIQGGESGEHQFRLDGASVFDPVSLGRFLGAFSPLAIERLTVRKAGFGAPYGSWTAGVVDLEQTLAAGSQPDVAATADNYAANARVTVPWTLRGRKASAMMAVRTSLWDVAPVNPLERALREWTAVDRLLLDRFVPAAAGLPLGTGFAPLAVGTDLGFTDIHAGARAELGGFRSLAASLYVGRNRAATTLGAVGAPGTGEPPALAARDEYRWQSLAAQVRHDWLVSARTSTSLRLRLSDHRLRHESAVVLGGAALPEAGTGPHEGNGVTEAALEGSLTYQGSAAIGLAGGFELARVESDMTMDNGVFRAMVSRTDAVRTAAWSELRLRLGDALGLDIGSRATWVPARGRVYAEPRLALHRDGERVSWRLATGVYRQFVNQFDLATAGASTLVPSVRFWLPVDRTVEPPETYHAAGELAWRAGTGVEVRGEAYYKWQPGILALDYAALLDGPAVAEPEELVQSRFLGRSRGRAVGGGVRVIRDRGTSRLELGYDLGLSRRTFPSRFDGREQAVPWNEPHRVTAALDVRASSSVQLSARGRGIWGRTWGLRQAYFDLLTIGGRGDQVPIGLPDDARLPAWLELDLAATWTGRLGGTPVELGVAMLNATGRRNQVDSWLVPVASGDDVTYRRQPRLLPGRQPMLTLRIGR